LEASNIRRLFAYRFVQGRQGCQLFRNAVKRVQNCESLYRKLCNKMLFYNNLKLLL
jgi:hypothetical protein